jgi:serine/threonine protein kinase
MSDLSVGSTIAGCRLEAVAGRGGMGVVYRATQLALERSVALKAIAPQLAQDAAYRERFQRESQIAASIDHPNVIPVYEAGELDQTLYLIMRWVDGTDLRALLASCGRLLPARAVRLLRPVASAPQPTVVGLSIATSSPRTSSSPAPTAMTTSTST